MITKIPTRRLFLSVLAIICMLIVVFAFSRAFIYPPLEGCFQADLFAVMDGSQGYLILRNGEIYLVNRGGTYGDSQSAIGTYVKSTSNCLELSFFENKYPRTQAKVSLFTLKFEGTDYDYSAMGPTHNERNICKRIFDEETKSSLYKLIQNLKTTQPNNQSK